MSSACVLWFPWSQLRPGVRQINQLDGIEYVAARELALKTPECRDGQHGTFSKCAGSGIVDTSPSQSVIRFIQLPKDAAHHGLHGLHPAECSCATAVPSSECS